MKLLTYVSFQHDTALYLIEFVEIAPLNMKSIWCLFPHCQSLPHHQIVFSIQSVALIIEHQVHLNTIACLSEYGQSNCGFSIRRRPSIFVDVALWKHCTSDCENFRCGKVCCSNSIIITNFV
jgi:hypothetical protein